MKLGLAGRRLGWLPCRSPHFLGRLGCLALWALGQVVRRIPRPRGSLLSLPLMCPLFRGPDQIVGGILRGEGCGDCGRLARRQEASDLALGLERRLPRSTHYCVASMCMQ